MPHPLGRISNTRKRGLFLDLEYFFDFHVRIECQSYGALDFKSAGARGRAERKRPARAYDAPAPA
jgi:hypothetical protein